MHYSVVAIEDEKITLEDDAQNTHTILNEQVSDVVKEGDVLLQVGNAFIVDEQETKKRKELVHKLLEGLLHAENEECIDKK